ncbi:MAG: hypothetical protein M1371_06065 [Actinobacteria bacterium]|nr:hypothetical protein [Actinomycetota bacterium]
MVIKNDLIKQLEGTRTSRVITYITGDRQPFATKIGADVTPIFNRHLEKMGKQEKISVFLFTSGGDMMTPIRLVKLIRSHSNKFEVIVPFRAHSAGTLLSIGADNIVMGKLGELSPVDPTTGHPFNPRNPDNQKQVLEVSVEDLNSYFMLAKEKAGVKDEQMIEVFKQLADKMHPLSLGNVYRAFRMTKILTERLLEMHMDKNKDSEKIKRIISELTGDICVHGYPITRDEADKLGLKIDKADSYLDKIMWELYTSYADDMKLDIPFHPLELLGSDKESADIKYSGAYIESVGLSDQFIFSGKAKRIIRDNKPAVDINIDSQRWVTVI